MSDKIQVIFLDFDGVLNSEGSFLYEFNRRKRNGEQGVSGPVNQTLCNVCTTNFQSILDKYSEAKIVLSTTWREMFDLPWLKAKLKEYHIEGDRIIGITPSLRQESRGLEINTWLAAHPEVNGYIVIDDNDWGISQFHRDFFIQTEWGGGGLTSDKADEAKNKLSSWYRKKLKEEQDGSN